VTVGTELAAWSGCKQSAQRAHTWLIHPVQHELGAFLEVKKINLNIYADVRQQ